MVAPIQTRRSDPLGIRDVCKKPGKSMDPLPRKMHICIDVYTLLGGQFRESPRPFGIHELPRGPELVCFVGGGLSGVPVPPVFRPRSHGLSQWGGGRGV